MGGPLTQQSIDHPPGTRFGFVRIVGPAPTLGKGRRWVVRCRCGDEREVDGWSLRQRPPKSHRRCKT